MSKSTRSVFLMLVIAGILGLGDTARTQNAAPSPLRVAANEILVEFQPWATDGSKDTLRRSVRAIASDRLRSAGEGQLERVRIAAGSDLNAAILALRSNPLVRIAEPNWIYTHDADSNDPYYTQGSMWGLYGDGTTPANQFGSQAGEAWAAGATGNPNVYVAVIDEGVDFNHPDLASNVWTNPFDPVDGFDNDGNGYVDDVHGWDFFQNNNSVYDGGPGNTTVDSHGTHVSGTIGAVGGNAAGVVGVNWDVTIIPLKFLGPQGGSTSAAVQALDYLVDLKQRHGLNIVAANASWGGGGYSQALHDAILRAAKAGILFVAAAGNGNSQGVGQNNDVTPRYPTNYTTLVGTSTESAASYEAVISVAALTSSGARATYSNYGATTVDLGAPGSGIWSTTPSGTYASFSGTSMATPHVTGAAALYSALNPGVTAQQTRAAILQSASSTPTSSMSGVTVTGGRLNLGVWFGGTTPAPSAPSGLSATPISASQINLAWTDNSNNETGFSLERCTGAACTNFVQIATLAANTTSYQNIGLASSTTYRYQVRAANGSANSGYSNIASATTQAGATVPAAPTLLGATAVSSSQINLSWTDNANNETGFSVERCTGATCTNFVAVASLGANVTTYQNTGLSPATAYRYQVRALNAAGNSAYSNIASATTQAATTAPAAPTALAATAVSSSQINLTWADNANNETGFLVERCAGATCTNFVQIASLGANTTSYQNTGLSASTTYRYQVRATNAAGPSGYSNIAAATTSAVSSGAPAAPSNLVAVMYSPKWVKVTWTDNSANENGFRLERCIGAGCVNFAVYTSVPANVATYEHPATAGTTYRYRVVAYNYQGVSAYTNIAEVTAP
jgi:subtilisin family serine protease